MSTAGTAAVEWFLEVHIYLQTKFLNGKLYKAQTQLISTGRLCCTQSILWAGCVRVTAGR